MATKEDIRDAYFDGVLRMDEAILRLIYDFGMTIYEADQFLRD